MKYFCPLENVGKIEGRKRNDTIVKTTTINGWEISSDGIYAGSNNTLTDLPIVSKNWSIDKNGNSNFKSIKNNYFVSNDNNFIIYRSNEEKALSYDRKNNSFSLLNDAIKIGSNDVSFKNWWFFQENNNNYDYFRLAYGSNKQIIFSINHLTQCRINGQRIILGTNTKSYEYTFPEQKGTIVVLEKGYKTIEIKKITFPYDCWFFDVSGSSYRTREEKSMLLYDNQLLNSQITIRMGNSAQGSKDRVTILETYLDIDKGIMIKYTLGNDTTIKEIALSSIGKSTDTEDKKPKTIISKLMAVVE